MGTRWSDGYSADVQILLFVRGQQLRVAQIGPETLILRDLQAIPPGTTAKIVLKIDDHQETRDVVLTAGSTGQREKITYESARSGSA